MMKDIVEAIIRDAKHESKTAQMVRWIDKERHGQDTLLHIHISSSIGAFRGNVTEMNKEEVANYIECYANEFLQLVNSPVETDPQLF